LIRYITIFLLSLIGTFIIDQGIKTLFLDGFYHAGQCIDWQLHINHGVAFSMFSFLGEYLKWLQLFIIIFITVVAFKEQFIQKYALAMGFLLGGALGNLYDRFIHGGVIDYVVWHCGFNYAVFNYADVAIDIAVIWIAISVFRDKSK
jgi:signal peptidase II